MLKETEKEIKARPPRTAAGRKSCANSRRCNPGYADSREGYDRRKIYQVQAPRRAAYSTSGAEPNIAPILSVPAVESLFGLDFLVPSTADETLTVWVTACLGMQLFYAPKGFYWYNEAGRNI